MRAAGGFAHFTGVGEDHIPPHLFAWLSDDVIQRIEALFAEAELVGKLPQFLGTLLAHLIPKATGGKRPIALLASLLRLWERVRVAAVQRWRSDHSREWNWAQKGRSSERAVWVQSVFDEAAQSRGWESAAALLDLEKAFEHIPLMRVWEAGKKHRFPLTVLRLELECCSFQRRLVFRSAVSSPARTLSAVAAGLSFATDCLLLVLVDIIDAVTASYDRVRTIGYVDDLTLHCIGPPGQVVSDLTGATRVLIDGLERQCRLVVDRSRPWRRSAKHKSVAIGSSSTSRRRLTTSMGCLGMLVKSKVKHLGVDYHPGAKRAYNSVHIARWKKFLGRKARYRKLKCRGGAHVARTGLVPAARYGASLTGVGDAQLRSLATAAAEVRGTLRGRSSTARLAVHREDPRPSINIKPIMEYVNTPWNRDMAVDVMDDAWKIAQLWHVLDGNSQLLFGNDSRRHYPRPQCHGAACRP